MSSTSTRTVSQEKTQALQSSWAWSSDEPAQIPHGASEGVRLVRNSNATRRVGRGGPSCGGDSLAG